MNKIKKIPYINAKRMWYEVAWLYKDKEKTNGQTKFTISIEKVLSNYEIETFEKSNEYKFYKFVENLPIYKRKYFIRLYDYNIKTCKEKFKKPWESKELVRVFGIKSGHYPGELEREIKNSKKQWKTLDRSKKCLTITMDYAGILVSEQYPTKNELSQMLRIFDIMHEGKFVFLYLDTSIISERFSPKFGNSNGQVKLATYSNIKKVTSRNHLFKQKGSILWFLRICSSTPQLRHCFYNGILHLTIHTFDRFIKNMMTIMYNSNQFPNIKKYAKKILSTSLQKDRIFKTLDNKSMDFMFVGAKTLIHQLLMLWMIFDSNKSIVFWKKYGLHNIKKPIVSKQYMVRILNKYF